jgi:hypothetical protein
MDSQELMFAVEVRRIALEIQAEEFARAKREAAGKLENVNTILWHIENPMVAFAPRAYKQVSDVLKAIKAEQAAEQNTALNESLGL